MIDKKAYREIVENLLQNNGQYSPPINVSAIANDLGITVLEETMPQGDVSGFIAKRPDGKICIYVNKDEHLNRQRFTIAHELAHYYLHYKDKSVDQSGVLDFVEYRNGIYTEESTGKESEANAFAAELLVPYYALEALWQAGYTDPAELANKFVVSTEMMIYRLKNCFKDLNRAAR
ncbi:MAG: ImmA/IrrE family metallo-endopeptidase [Oscillospiraceae bacterium]|nr:ImmA/IrrE family metallo-endopeptidase [Oscillospiraceae bacterium]